MAQQEGVPWGLPISFTLLIGQADSNRYWHPSSPWGAPATSPHDHRKMRQPQRERKQGTQMSVALALNKRRLGCAGGGSWASGPRGPQPLWEGAGPGTLSPRREGGAHRGEELPEGLWTAGAQLTELPAGKSPDHQLGLGKGLHFSGPRVPEVSRFGGLSKRNPFRPPQCGRACSCLHGGFVLCQE